ncbi:MAG: hypothetical protein RR190_07540, partial [Bacteroidales bacterium]
NGKGSIDFDSVALKWNYRAQGLDDESVVSIRVYAIEMVYVPEGGFDIGDGDPSQIKSLSYKVATNEIHGNGTTFVKADTIWKIILNSPSDYMYYYNGPSTGQQTIINSGRMNSGYASFPLGNWSSGTTNIAGYSMYQERYHSGNSHQLDAYSTYPISGTGELIDRILSLTNWTRSLNSSSSGWHSLIIKLPQPFRATHFTLGWWSNVNIPYYSLRGSNDGNSWNTIVGSYNSGNCPGGCGGGNDRITTTVASSQSQAYQWYEWRFYNSYNSYLYLSAFGIADRTNGGHPDNGWYYGKGVRGFDRMDTTWKTGAAVGTQRHYPASASMPFTFVEGMPIKKLTSSPTYPNAQKAYYMMKHE